MQSKDPKPEIMRLEELALLVKFGEIKLPKFQRPFVWQRPEMLKLLDSIYKGYPIGSILIWNSSQQLTSERSISGLNVNVDATNIYPTNYLLDGQQRLTTLCGALFWDGDTQNSIWNINFDLEKEEFVYPSDNNLINLFPLNKLIDTSDFIQQCMKFSHHPKGKKYFSLAERLLKSIKDYKIAVVKIGDMTIDEIAPIFERINSTGRKLTIVDLMMAATWSDGFDLSSEITEIKDKCRSVGFDNLSDTIILRSISAAAGLGINKDDIQKLRSKKPEELREASQSAGLGLVLALRFLSEQVSVLDYSYIPYGLQLTHLAEFYRIQKEVTEDHISELIRWFWYTSTTRYYAGANTTQNGKDLAQMRAFARNEINYLFDRSEVDISQLIFDRFNLRNATSTTFTLLLNSLMPTTTVDGRPLDGGHLIDKSSRYFVSFCPSDGHTEKLNISKILYPYSDRRPPFDVLETVDLERHLLDRGTVEASKKDIPEFIVKRANIVQSRIAELTGCATKYNLPTESRLELDQNADLVRELDDMLGSADQDENKEG